MNNTALGAVSNKKERTSALLAKHMRNSTMKNIKIRRCRVEVWKM